MHGVLQRVRIRKPSVAFRRNDVQPDMMSEAPRALLVAGGMQLIDSLRSGFRRLRLIICNLIGVSRETANILLSFIGWYYRCGMSVPLIVIQANLR